MDKTELELYNPERKEEYFKTLSNNTAKINIIRRFKQIGALMEKSINKDISDMNKAEMLGTIVELGLYDYSSIRQIIAFMRDYIDWCISNKLTDSIINAARTFKSFDVSIERNLSYACVKDDEYLKEKIYSVYEFGNCYKEPIIFFLIWMGIPIKDALLLKNSDVDVFKGVVYYDNQDILIPKAFLETFKNYQINNDGVRDNGRGETSVSNISSPYFIKKLNKGNMVAVGGSVLYKSMLCSLSFFKKLYFSATGRYTDINISSVTLSGEFYRLYQIEKSGIEITDSVLIGENIESSETNQRYKLLTIATDKRLQYNVYKKVFWG